MSAMTYDEIVRFHGHECPGLAMGYRMARAAMAALGSQRSEDEELVAIVENDACGVDALQCVTGCTFGKGNMVFRDYGKAVYTVYSRSTGDGVRVVFHGRGVAEAPDDTWQSRARRIREAPDEDIIAIEHVTIPAPEPAQIRKSARCDFCGERVMESRLRMVNGRMACIPCAKTRH